jgi:hypothetical protein
MIKLVKDFEDFRYETVVCADGTEISIQAGYHFYSTPRLNVELSQYTHMEVGFPTREIECLNDYAETDDYTHTIYAYVPVSVIEEAINSCGGYA